MNYKQKYLKYKLKYLNLKKKMSGGMEGDIDNSLSPEIILREHLSLCDDELVDKIINEAGDNIDEYFDEYSKALEKIFKLNISDKDKIDIENKVTNTLKKISEKQNNKAIQAVKKSECAKVEAKQLAEKSDRKISEAELAAAETAAAIMSSATEALMSTIAKPLLEEAVARENKTIVDDFDGYDDYNPDAYEETLKNEYISDCYSEEEDDDFSGKKDKEFVL